MVAPLAGDRAARLGASIRLAGPAGK